MYEVRTASIIKQTLPVLILMALGGTLAGLFLNAARSSLDVFPGLLVLVPAMQNLRGSISGSMASKLSTALHQGTVRAAFLHNEDLGPFIFSSLSLTATMSAVIGILSYLFCLLYGITAPSPFIFLIISMTVGIMAGSAHLLINILISIASFKKGLDPDNVSIPFLAVMGDIVTIMCFMVVVGMVT